MYLNRITDTAVEISNTIFVYSQNLSIVLIAFLFSYNHIDFDPLIIFWFLSRFAKLQVKQEERVKEVSASKIIFEYVFLLSMHSC